jgi:hypothetical protein
MVSHKDRLPKRNIVRDGGNGRTCAFCVFRAALAIIVESLRAILCAFHERSIFVTNFTAKF